jgi:hypothetical protein
VFRNNEYCATSDCDAARFAFVEALRLLDGLRQVEAFAVEDRWGCARVLIECLLASGVCISTVNRYPSELARTAPAPPSAPIYDDGLARIQPLDWHVSFSRRREAKADG